MTMSRLRLALVALLFTVHLGEAALAANDPLMNGRDAAPFAIFNDNGGERDRFQHLLFLAEHGRDARDRGRKYRNLGAVLVKAGRHKEALRAYEAGALEGDAPSANIVVQAWLDRAYKPQKVAALVSMSVLPKAQSGSVSSALLMADLLASGKIKGEGFETSGYWLLQAAKLGSGTAQRRLAEAAERRGEIKTAANYYAALDKTGGKLDRALRQAKVYYLGQDVRQNADIGIAWLKYAAAIDAEAAGKLAAKLIRTVPGSDAEDLLLEFADAAGVSVTSEGGRAGPSTRLAAAASPAEREAVLAALRSEADAGAIDSAIVLWRALNADRADAETQRPYLLVAAKAGNRSAITTASKLLLRSLDGSPETAALLEAVQAAADGGNVDAMLVLANLFAAGGPVSLDPAKSLFYFRAAADKGDAEAQFRVGLYFSQGAGNEADMDLARQYLAAAAAQGSLSAQAYLDALPVSG
jgi:TPR repeat protein